MTALPKNFASPARPPYSKRNLRSRRDPSPQFKPANSAPTPIFRESSATLDLPDKTLPTGLQFLQRFQQATTVVTLSLVSVALGIYGYSVYVPKTWSKEFHKLQTLQKYERQLINSNESLKHQLAEQAVKPNSGLVKIMPQQNIFLAASSSKLPSTFPQVAPPAQKLLLSKQPIAY